MRVRALVKLFIDGAIRKPGEEFNYDGPRRNPKQLEILDRERRVASPPPKVSKVTKVEPPLVIKADPPEATDADIQDLI